MISTSPTDPVIDTQIDSKTVDPDKLLHDLLQSDDELIHIAAAHKISLRQLIAWCNQPGVRKLLDDADDLALRRAAHKSAQARQLAITVLTEHCRALFESARDRDLASRAARALMRAPTTDDAEPNAPGSEPSGASRRTLRAPNSRRRALPAPHAEANRPLRIPVFSFHPPLPISHLPAPQSPVPLSPLAQAAGPRSAPP